MRAPVLIASNPTSHRAHRRAALAAVAVFLVATRASGAQTTGGKFWAAIIPGYGVASTNGAQSVTTSGFGGPGYGPYRTVGLTAQFGERVNRWLRLGASVRYAWQVTTDWPGEPSPVVRHIQAFAAVPLPLFGWQHPSPVTLSVAVGAAHYSEAYYSGGCASGGRSPYCWTTLQAIDTRNGWGTDVSISYEAPVVGGFSLTPLLRYEYCHVGARSTEAASPTPNFTERIVEFGVGVTYH